MKQVLIIMLLVTFSGVAASKPYNVLFIAIDDLNDWVGCYGGHPDSITPNIDKLAAGGMRFTNAQCAAPACIPSRSAFMTGLYPSTTGLYGNFEGEFMKYNDLKKNIIIPQYFSQNGYHTMGVGKLLHSSPSKTFWDEPSKLKYHSNPVPEKTVKGDPRTVQDFLNTSLPLNVETTKMTDWKMADWAAEKLKVKYDKPFFLACGLYRPHVPRHAPLKYYKRFPLDKISLPKVNLNDFDDLKKRAGKTGRDIVANKETYKKVVQAYLANISFVDDCVGHLLSALEKSVHRDNTIVVLFSDHGMHVGEKFQFSKFTLWEEAARVVLVCKGPGIKAATVCKQPVNLVDLYPTLIDVCKLPPKNGLDGKSFLPQLKEPNTKRTYPSLTADYTGYSLRSTRWRYIANHNGSEELYDHSKDENEWKNLASNPEFDEIKKSLRKFLPKNPAECRSEKGRERSKKKTP